MMRLGSNLIEVSHDHEGGSYDEVKGAAIF